MKMEDEEATQDYLESCLFVGVMKDEQKEKLEESEEEEELKHYDPASMRFEGESSYEKVWSDILVKQIQISCHRYSHYIQSPDCIKNEEISKYKKEWMSHALDLLQDNLVKEHSELLRLLF
jgi:hypothetical protein